MSNRETLDYLWDVVKYKTVLYLRTAITYVRFFAVIKCPVCKGEGGWMSGYYEPEWECCPVCSFGWDYSSKNWFRRIASEIEFEGRTSPSKWLKSKIANTDLSWSRIIKCKLGWHVPFSKGEQVCCHCYTLTDIDRIS